jgi:uncharacterized membrane protein YdjX (TVP38/TMEM64 family)
MASSVVRARITFYDEGHPARLIGIPPVMTDSDPKISRNGDAPPAVGQRTTMLWRIAPVVVIVAAAIGFFAFGLDEYVSFEVIRANQAELQTFVDRNIVLAALGYMAIYTVFVAASVPGAIVLTITGGFLFGTFLGTGLTLVGATLGATGIFLIARSAIGDLLRHKAGGAVSKMADGFREDAFNYLLALRLIPVFPFFIVNLAPAFLGVPLRTFIGATFIGIAPGTFVYSTVGAGLGSVFARGEEFSAAGILTPEIVTAMIGLAVLAVLPVIYRRFIASRKTSRLPK